MRPPTRNDDLLVLPRDVGHRVVQLGDLVGGGLDDGTPYFTRRDAIAEVPQMNRISANTLDMDPPLRCVQGRRIQCGETALVYYRSR